MSEFNHGLEQGLELGALKERKRIIDLLNGKHFGGTHEHSPECTCRIQSYAAIQLIEWEDDSYYPLPLPTKTAENTETALLSRPMKFKKENK